MFNCDLCGEHTGFWDKYISKEHECGIPPFSSVESKHKPREDNSDDSTASRIVDGIGDVISSIGDSIGDIDIDLD